MLVRQRATREFSLALAGRMGRRCRARCAGGCQSLTGPLRRLLLVASALTALALTPARAVEPGEMLTDPVLEARARKLSQELRCVVCQNQSIDDSNAPLAHDLRVIVRERLAAGDSDVQVLAFVEARYGEFVLLRPRLKPQTTLLWLAPLLMIAGAAIFLLRAQSRQGQGRGQAAPLSDDEKRRLDELLHSGERAKQRS